jgi:acyl-CoA synthetase (AMP-forming)/AMP-acid ligase II/thioesterase domain-containing protein/acyl carrier protein
LLDQARYARETLNELGVGRGDRLAMVLPNGPQMAVAFLSLSTATTLAPLNPAYSSTEYSFFLNDLSPKALLAEFESDGVALAVAKERGIPIIRLRSACESSPGRFTLESTGTVATTRVQGAAQPDDLALLLHTSGTTSRPKLVPLTHRNLCASAANIVESLHLTSQDRCLNLMPLFHIHGLIAGLLASIASGASVICPPGFYATDFFGWMAGLRPTWYTGVPTMHQAIASRAAAHSDSIAAAPLRFIRSSSASLPPTLLAELEKAFAAPVIEAYGMTEAAHQMASNPLPPGLRKPGSVGVAAGPEVAIMSTGEEIVGQGNVGEVVVRGANVMGGYLGDASATAASFTDGWFHTGDQGYLDHDGYLYLTGRLKELINRGGEKIAPREIDEVLLSHPSVAQAVAFALPHPYLGETVAAAIVLRDGSRAGDRELREYAAAHLAPFKVPEVIQLLPEIPKGPTGKVQRIGMADRLGLIGGASGHQPRSFVAPATNQERSLARIWAEVLDIDFETIGVHDQFVELGGDSMLATRLATRVEAAFGLRVPLAQFFLAATVSEQAKLLAEPGLAWAWRSLVPIQTAGSRPPLFCVHGVFGDVLFYHSLSQELGVEQPVYGLQARGLDGLQVPHKRVEDMAAAYIDEINEIQTDGPYCLLGYSAGGSVAYEMAQRLVASGKRVEFLGIVDHSAPIDCAAPSLLGHAYARRFWRNLAVSMPHWLRRNWEIRRRDLPSYCRWRWRLAEKTLIRALSGKGLRVSSGLERLDEIDAEVGGIPLAELPAHRRQVLEAQLQAPSLYEPKQYEGSLVLFRAQRQPIFAAHDPALGWGGLVRGGVDVRAIPGSHDDLFKQPSVRTLGEIIRSHLDRI